MGGWLAYSAIVFKEMFLDGQPTIITDVRPAEVGRDYAIITWETNHHTKNNKINYGEDRSYGYEAFSGNKEKIHTVRLENLNPNTKYIYEVMSQNKNYIFDTWHEFWTGGIKAAKPAPHLDTLYPVLDT